MKTRFLALLLCCAMLLPMAALGEAADAVSSASLADYYGDFALVGDDLMDAINSTSGFYLVCTTNPDGTANAGFFIYGMVKVDDKFYLMMGLAPNQTTANLDANPCGVAVYAASPAAEEGAKPYAVSGARITFQAVTDEAVMAKLNEMNTRGTSRFYEVVAVRPLG